MTVSSKGAKRRIVVRRKIRSGSRYTPPKLPAKPSVTSNRSYGRTKRGGYIVARFQVMSRFPTYTKQPPPWIIWDVEEALVAKGTKQEGYQDKEKAVRVARKYRDEYGAWAVMPF